MKKYLVILPMITACGVLNKSNINSKADSSPKQANSYLSSTTFNSNERDKEENKTELDLFRKNPRGQLEKLDKIINSKPEIINYTDKKKNTPLHIVLIQSLYLELIEILASHPKTDFTIANYRGNNVFHVVVKDRPLAWGALCILIKAVQKNHHKFITILNQKNIYGNTPLHLSAKKNLPYFSEKLLCTGANLHIKNNKGNTPLHELILSERESEKMIEHVKILLGFGANPYIKNNNEDSVIALAKKKNMSDDIITLLEDA